MKANAPEKLYLSKNIYSTYLYQVPDTDDETAVEYTRTDAFVEKARSWLKENCKNYIIVDIDNKYEGIDGLFLEDFLKYMKGE